MKRALGRPGRRLPVQKFAQHVPPTRPVACCGRRWRREAGPGEARGGPPPAQSSQRSKAPRTQWPSQASDLGARRRHPIALGLETRPAVTGMAIKEPVGTHFPPPLLPVSLLLPTQSSLALDPGRCGKCSDPSPASCLPAIKSRTQAQSYCGFKSQLCCLFAVGCPRSYHRKLVQATFVQGCVSILVQRQSFPVSQAGVVGVHRSPSCYLVLGKSHLLFGLRTLILSASVFWDMGPPHAPTPGIVKDAGVRASKAGHWRQNMFLGRRGSCVSQLTQPSVA